MRLAALPQEMVKELQTAVPVENISLLPFTLSGARSALFGSPEEIFVGPVRQMLVTSP
jgi:hypothetical protein